MDIEEPCPMKSIGIIASKYKLVGEIGKGTFGQVYIGEDLANGQKIAIKLESKNSKYQHLINEFKLYKLLKDGNGIANMLWYGVEGSYNVLVMEFLGPDLENLFNYCSRRFSLKTVLMLADQMISLIESVHKVDFIHGDIKPDNFAMGPDGNQNTVYLIDFGLARRYKEADSCTHIPFQLHLPLTGTARYASISAHVGIEQSRRDDMESLAYILIYFTRGRLPWQGITASTKAQRDEKIAERKMTTSIAALCKGSPEEFATFLSYCRNMGFQETPDYMYLRQVFKILFRKMNYSWDYIFDWCLLDQQFIPSKQPCEVSPQCENRCQESCSDGEEYVYEEI